MEPIKLENSVDIILTPQFYTFLREELEIKFAYQAKQIAASLFDDYIDAIEDHQFYVYKCNNAWCFYAYSIEEIDRFLESKGIEKHRVAKIYFAQELEKELEKPMLLSGDYVLQSIDGIVTLLPKRFLEDDIEYVTLDMNNLKLKNGVTMGSSLNSFISLKETIVLGLLLTFLGTFFLVEGNRLKSSLVNEEAKLSELLESNPKYQNNMLRESILDKYKKIDTIERAKRQAMKDISKLLSAKSQLKELTIDKDKVTAVISTQNKNIAKQVKEHAEVKKMKTIDMGTENDLKVEVKL
jgi:DNA modification methylase